jgi:glycosyltransferase involved in cell wall biosynthesis
LSIPEILKREPNTKFCIVGFGPFREVAELMLECLASNRLDVLQKLVDDNDPLFHGEDGATIPCIKEILDTQRSTIEQTLSEISVDIKEQVFFTGIVAHKQLKHLLPCADVQIAASVFPEAFGMVAVEAMACGVYPVLTYQSAFAEITDELKEHLTKFDIEIKNVLLDGNASANISENAIAFFDLQEKIGGDLSKFQHAMRDVVTAKYSWAGIAQKYIGVYER